MMQDVAVCRHCFQSRVVCW